MTSRRPARVAHITPAFHPARAYGGPTESAYQLSLALARRGHEVRVLTTDADGPDRVLDLPDKGHEVTLAPGVRARYCPRIAITSVSPALLTHLGELVRWSEVVHLNAIYNFTTFPTLFAAHALGRPVVWSARGALQRWSGARRPTAKAIWEHGCRLIAPAKLVLHFTSQEEAAESASRVPKAEAVVIPNGVHVPEAQGVRDRARDFMPGGVLRLVALGRLHPIKGLDNLIRACGALKHAPGGAPFTLTLAGAGDAAYTRELEGLIALLSLGATVKLVGEIRGETAKARLFAEADVLVAPSHRENFGIAIAEALAHGVPVIAGRGTPWSGLIERSAGLWVDNTPESLAQAIAAARAMPLAAMGACGRAWALEAYSWDGVAGAMSELYQGLCAAPS
jgi:glycosyltransferase involved in cell wall biosynthesis